MSNFEVVSITQGTLIQSKTNKTQPLKEFFSAIRLNTEEDASLLPAPLVELKRWEKLELLLQKAQRHKLFFAIAPLFAFSVAANGAHPLLWLLVPVSLPLCVFGIFCFWAESQAFFAKKLELLHTPFVALIGNRLFENLPQLRQLHQEATQLQHVHDQASHKIQEVLKVEKQLLEKSQALVEDSGDLISSLHDEKARLEQVKTQASTLREEIHQKIAELEKTRKIIHQRAELEVIRNQARALSQDDRMRFSQQALADLEVDAHLLRSRINDFSHTLEREKIYFALENKSSS